MNANHLRRWTSISLLSHLYSLTQPPCESRVGRDTLGNFIFRSPNAGMGLDFRVNDSKCHDVQILRK